MVVPTDVQACFIAAAFFADVGASSIEAASKESAEQLERVYQRFRFRAVAYSSVFVGPSATLFLLGWPAWESQYWGARFETTGGRPFDAALFALFLLLLFIGGWFGNWIGFRWVLSGARKKLRDLYLSALLLTVGIVLVQWPAPIRLGGYEAFRRDPSTLPYIWQDRTFFIPFCTISAYCVVPLVVWFFRIRKGAKEGSAAG